LEVQHGTQNGLGKAAVEVLVKACDSRHDEARREIFGDVGVRAETERPSSIVAQATLPADGEWVENEIVAMGVLIADARAEIAARFPRRWKGPRLGDFDVDVGVSAFRAQTGPKFATA
jgi:hypothetical protein